MYELNRSFFDESGLQVLEPGRATSLAQET